jgi:hypothetical protein
LFRTACFVNAEAAAAAGTTIDDRRRGQLQQLPATIQGQRERREARAATAADKQEQPPFSKELFVAGPPCRLPGTRGRLLSSPRGPDRCRGTRARLDPVAGGGDDEQEEEGRQDKAHAHPRGDLGHPVVAFLHVEDRSKLESYDDPTGSERALGRQRERPGRARQREETGRPTDRAVLYQLSRGGSPCRGPIDRAGTLVRNERTRAVWNAHHRLRQALPCEAGTRHRVLPTMPGGPITFATRARHRLGSCRRGKPISNAGTLRRRSRGQSQRRPINPRHFQRMHHPTQEESAPNRVFLIMLLYDLPRGTLTLTLCSARQLPGRVLTIPPTTTMTMPHQVKLVVGQKDTWRSNTS